MKPLLKIRLTLLKRNKKIAVFNYILIPVLCIFFVLTNFFGQSTEHFDKQKYSLASEKEYLFKDQNYSELSPFLNNTSLLVNSNDIGKKFANFIKQILNINVNYYINEADIDSKEGAFGNVIYIFYDEEKDSYSFSHTSRSINSDKINLLPFNYETFSTANASSIFYSSKNILEEELKLYSGVNSQNKRYLLYQSFIAKFLIEEIAQKSIQSDVAIESGLNSFPSFNKLKNDPNMANYVPFLFTFYQYSFCFMAFISQMADEKEKKLDQFIKRQGVTDFNNFMSWLCLYLIVTVPSNICTFFTFFMSLKLHQVLCILPIILYNISLFLIIVVLIDCIKTKKNLMIIGSLVMFGSLLLSIMFYQFQIQSTGKGIMGFLFGNISFSFVPVSLSYLQTIDSISWDVLWLVSDGVAYLEIILMFLVQIVVLLLIDYFCRAYKKSGLSFGLFLKSIFTKVERKYVIKQSFVNEINTDSDKRENLIENVHEEISNVNSNLKTQNKYLSINNITKKFGDLTAVDNFSCDLFQNEIFVLLGHNGAGKTTLIKIISGEEDPNFGDIFLNNISLITNKNYMYQNIEVCSQDNIFFDYLTVREQLNYLLEIKGENGNPALIEDLITKIELTDKKDAVCSTLSGGQKRKMCIALALIGNSQLILLDEPTSGMDVIAKKKLWKFLKEYKNDKIMILTTHSLDEAEYLADRIGIMSGGKFICSGSSSYLKEKYPCGFNINLLVNADIFNNEKKNELFRQIKEMEPKAEIKIASKGIFKINIPADNKKIKEIFGIIEKSKNEYGIEDYTVSSTSLEDVFLKLNNKITLNLENEPENINNTSNQSIKILDFNINKDFTFFRQLFSHLNRGFLTLWRGIGSFVLEMLGGLIIIYIYIFAYSNAIEGLKSRSLNLVELLESNTIYVYEDQEDFLENSFVYDSNSVSLKKIDEDSSSIENFIDQVFENSKAHIAKGGIKVKKTSSNEYQFYNTELPMTIPGYNMANSMLFVSGFLKKEYNLNAAIFTELNHKVTKDGVSAQMEMSEIIYVFTTIFICVFSINQFLGMRAGEKVKERVTNIKHLLYLSGSNLWSYWIGYIILDTIKSVIFIALLCIGVYFLSSSAYYLFLNFLTVIISSLLLVYSLSFLCEKEESLAAYMNLFFMFFILLLSIIYGISVAIGHPINTDSFIKRYSYTFIDITPLTSLILSSIRVTVSYFLYRNYDEYAGQEKIIVPKTILGFSHPYEYVKTSIMAQLINIIIYTGLLAFIESGKLGRLWNSFKVKFLIKENKVTFSTEQKGEEFIFNNNMNEPVDEANPLLGNNNTVPGNNANQNNQIVDLNSYMNNYVQHEIDKINQHQNDETLFLTTKLINVRKTYWYCCKKGVRAINNLYLGLENNEKFGLLGFNGSGKTTTFKSITREILYDYGEISIFGRNNKSNTQFNEIRKEIGYCPQENPLFDYMTVEELMKFYIQLKGSNENYRKIAEDYDLKDYLNTYCINLSGGNKRKLTFALALINSPKILLLDEPSTGVDPESRRIMWKNIMQLTRNHNNFNMILSTHSIEEAEVLCDTVSWLKNGNFVCVGNPEKLKIAYSAGYKLHLKFIKQKNEGEINNNDINNDGEVINKLDSIAEKFRENVANIGENELVRSYFGELLNVMENLKEKCQKITTSEIGKDSSFEFVLHANKEKQDELFVEILNMKNTNQLISEVSISMEPLENILTKI